ncbi:hypothetical protein HU200_012027 [Digitaria exilis]|uniref:Uncharacterized protein n=1 Tax=Digitaria exilis TaxID=1010633 RepID=A0A835FGU4_9POAL|nr:hypothetical protein HU200_012027 [Digitaria exilis]
MKITVHSSKLVKPASATNPSIASSTPDTIPLLVFDRVNCNTYVSVIYIFRAPTPPNAALESGLARALAHYREWAGRLTGRAPPTTIVLTDDGARLVEATAGDVPLDAVLPLDPSPDVTRLHPRPPSADAEELMLVQLTRFACGGLAVGITAHHLVSDGRATANFLVAWSQATRGDVTIDPPPSTTAPPSSNPASRHFKKLAAPPHVKIAAEEVVVVHRVHFSREFISKLKSHASPPGASSRSCSTLRCVVAHLWRRITAARGLAGDDADVSVSTSVCIAVDGRARMRPPMPEGYTGNVVLWARPAAAARELVARPLRHAVELIDGEIARVGNGEYLASFVDFAAASGAVEEEGMVPAADAAEMVLSPNVEVDSWLRIPFYDLDFGGGRPCFFMPSYLPVEGLVILLPSCYGDGSVDAYVSLFTDLAQQLCSSLIPSDGILKYVFHHRAHRCLRALSVHEVITLLPEPP